MNSVEAEKILESVLTGLSDRLPGELPTLIAWRPNALASEVMKRLHYGHGLTVVSIADFNDLRKVKHRATNVALAWNDEGRNPAYHNAMKDELARNWPSLFISVRDLSESWAI